jgi:hypothetical protein
MVVDGQPLHPYTKVTGILWIRKHVGSKIRLDVVRDREKSMLPLGEEPGCHFAGRPAGSLITTLSYPIPNPVPAELL